MVNNPNNDDDDDFEDSKAHGVNPDNLKQENSKKIDPSIIIKRINLRDKLYFNIINFISTHIGDIDELKEIQQIQSRIHDIFESLSDTISQEYNTEKGKDESNLTVRGDTTKRKVIMIYRFFAYYIIKYDKNIVLWMESLITKGLFNDKSNIFDLNKSYSNIDIDIIINSEPSTIIRNSFNMLHNDGVFNKTQTSMFSDAADVVDNLVTTTGLFNSLTGMIKTFRNGIHEEFNIKVSGKIVRKSISIPFAQTDEISTVVSLMNEINKIVQRVVTVDTLRNRFIQGYKDNLQKLNFKKENIQKEIDRLFNEMKNGNINTLDDFLKLMYNRHRYVKSERDIQDMSNRVLTMNRAYKV